MPNRIPAAVQRLRDVLDTPSEVALTVDQASAVAELDGITCQSVLDALEDLRFLRRRSDGSYEWLRDFPQCG